MALADPVQLQRIIIENSYGQKLVGILHETGSKELVIICHGFRSSKERIPMVNLAAAFTNKGISAFRFDFTGNGESEGSFQYGNYRREADELRNVVQFFHAEKRLIDAVIGHSKGGNVVLLYASKYSDVSTVVNISGRFNLERGIEGRLGKDFFQRIKQSGYIDVKDRRGKIEYRVTEASLMDRLTIDMRAVSCGIQKNCRVLTVHGSKDKIIPVKDVMEFDKYIANHKMFIMELADHEYTSHQDELASVVLDFVTKSCKDESLPEQLSCSKTENIVHSRI
ncbi:BAAT/acyl-CoA thioester hydrolase carboxy-terminal protein [Heracleum sosnowskyi]|uniref:BAAT/acyl-CoA thioester hydrolase carboxy-terminal protein n=1 Tax=Heracleum sosnowskyi TaxID=360622 RepID=A0AAD8HYE1_9APIA|nr:BAAT/acyl-CoA thioester hydrolase carboxy-terminal protein [Heracleum sosnowskyi]